MKTILKPKSIWTTLGLLASYQAMGVAVVNADMITLLPVADTTLHQSIATSNFGSGPTFQAGGRRKGGEARALMQFDIAGNIPAGAMIDSAELTLRVTATPAGGPNSTFGLHSVLQEWGEGTGSDHGGTVGQAGQATWNNRRGAGLAWTTAGGSFTPQSSASKLVAGNGSYAFGSTPQLVSDVQMWLNSPANNFGWELISQSGTTSGSIRRFGSRGDTANAPQLVIHFTPVPEPGTLAIATIGGVILLGRVRSGRRLGRSH